MNRLRWIVKNLRLAGALALTLAAASGPPLTAACKSSSAPSSCCKVCTTGKACGDSCIPTTGTCSQPPGCACNG